MITFTTNMFVSELLNYREFDRVSNPAPKIPLIQSYNVDEVTEWVSKNGITKPLELSVYSDTVLLTDGNHRIVAADRLGYSIVPVTVTYFETFSELSAVFYDQTIKRFKQVK